MKPLFKEPTSLKNFREAERDVAEEIWVSHQTQQERYIAKLFEGLVALLAARHDCSRRGVLQVAIEDAYWDENCLQRQSTLLVFNRHETREVAEPSPYVCLSWRRKNPDFLEMTAHLSDGTDLVIATLNGGEQRLTAHEIRKLHDYVLTFADYAVAQNRLRPTRSLFRSQSASGSLGATSP